MGAVRPGRRQEGAPAQGRAGPRLRRPALRADVRPVRVGLLAPARPPRRGAQRLRGLHGPRLRLPVALSRGAAVADARDRHRLRPEPPPPRRLRPHHRPPHEHPRPAAPRPPPPGAGPAPPTASRANPLAALPSVHTGWAVLCAWFFVSLSTSPRRHWWW